MKYFIIVLIAGIAGFATWYVLTGNEAVRTGSEDVSPPLSDEAMVLTEPLSGTTVTSPLLIRGKARGTWFFEGSFPVVLTDWDGRIIAEHYVTAQSDWMTEDWVPFEGELSFEMPQDVGDFSSRGALILRKDNPSGLPEHDDARELTIFFW